MSLVSDVEARQKGSPDDSKTEKAVKGVKLIDLTVGEMKKKEDLLSE